MFSVVSVILSTGWGECSHVTITQGAWDLTVPGPPQSPEDMGPCLYRDPPTCSNLSIMKLKCLATGWFASYLNALWFYKGQSCLLDHGK